MWNISLLKRTKRTTKSENVRGTTAAVIIALVIMQIGAEARYYDDTAPSVENNELDSVTAMIEFRSMLQRIVQSPRDSSLTFLQVANNNEQEKDILQHVRGLRFHAAQHPMLCDNDLSSDNRLNVRIVSSSALSAPIFAEEKSKYVCAIWPVVGVKEASASQLEWLSANGIERRSGAWSSSREKERTQYLVMHLGDGSSRGNQVHDLLRTSMKRVKRDAPSLSGPIPTPLNSITSAELQIKGFRVESSDRAVTLGDDNVPELLQGTMAVLRLFGSGFTNQTIITFTEERHEFGGSCQISNTGAFEVIKGSVTPLGDSALVEIKIPKTTQRFYFCARQGENTTAGLSAKNTEPFEHQGVDPWMRLASYELPLPLWASIIIICTCLCFSALFSGLNLGLMSLDRTELKILKNTGTPNERKYAAKIQPVRDHGNFLLCSILLGNVLVNSTFTILLDGLTSGLVAVLCSTIAIVIFGEITPQAVCSRHGLAIGAKTIGITKVVMVITSPLAWPVSKFLDFVLGEEIGNVYNRERLKELVTVTKDMNDLDKDEVNIISGALELRKKTVGDVMTHIEDAFMLDIEAVLDFETVSDIMKSGFSRIPVFEKTRQNIVTLLYIKDLAFVDPDDNTPLKTLCEFYENPCHFVFDDMTLDVMFKQFKDGHKGHIAFVHRVNNEGDGDPFYETIGLITLEDVIEELIQAEIMDETDVFTDNRTKVKRQRKNKQDFSMFAERRENHRMRISPQLTLATFQYLSTSVDAFRRDNVSETILRRLLNQDIIHHVRCKGKEKDDPSMIIYQQGKPVDYFVLILEGRVEVTVGRENLVFESGPFTYFGIQALIQNVVMVDPAQQQPPSALGGTGVPDSAPQILGSLQSLNMDAFLRTTFVPDYSVRAVTDVIYMTIKRSLYSAAKRATLMEHSQRVGDQSNDAMDDEVEMLLYSLDEDERSMGADTINLMIQTPKTQSKAASPTNPNQEMINGRAGGDYINRGQRSQSIPTTVKPANGNNEAPLYKMNDDSEEEPGMPLLPRTKS